MLILPQQIAFYSPERRSELERELVFHDVNILNVTDSAYWLASDAFEPAWADCVWRGVQGFEVTSISDAQRKLRALSRHWRYFGDVLNRRGALIAKGVARRVAEPKAMRFPSDPPSNLLPAFTMASASHILTSHHVSRPTLDGGIQFIENKTVPPSRAYLKLWEALTLIGDRPRPGELVFDLGSSPGSWSWALAELGARVMSVDRAPLAASVSSPLVEFRKGDAFSVAPTPADWVFSDVICFPEKLLETVHAWLASGHCSKFVCNVKFTGAIDPAVAQRFREIPHSRIVHVFHGKNELTWMRHPSL